MGFSLFILCHKIFKAQGLQPSEGHEAGRSTFQGPVKQGKELIASFIITADEASAWFLGIFPLYCHISDSSKKTEESQEPFLEGRSKWGAGCIVEVNIIVSWWAKSARNCGMLPISPARVVEN